MKRLIITIAALVIALQGFAKSPKYVFYFIGDGMGVNMFTYAQYYKAACEGKNGTLPLNFATFPVAGMATTWCTDREVTDSAASGTALATGEKTYYGAIGVDTTKAPLKTIAEVAKEKGRKIAIMTTEGINGATPAAFAAHQEYRKLYDQILNDMLHSGFDFFGGNGYSNSAKDKVMEGFDAEKEIRKSGYTLVKDSKEFTAKYKKADKMLFLSEDLHATTYSIDRKYYGKNPLSLTDILKAGVEFLMKDGCGQGFFIMAEEAFIDGAAHGNDAASEVLEILELEKAVAYALEFYRQHPDETAIIVTADHDTGATGIKPKNPEHIKYLDYQTCSAKTMTKLLRKEFENRKSEMSWEEVKSFISTNTGLWSKIKVKDEDAEYLKGVYDKTMAKALMGKVGDEFGYNETAEIVYAAIKILDKYAGVTWTTTDHSGSPTPLFYLGPNTELFSPMGDNARTARSVMKLISE